MVEKIRGTVAKSGKIILAFAQGTGPEQVQEAGRLLAEALLAGGKVLACGNGGSAVAASHLVSELMVRFARDRKALPAISLPDNPAAVTAAGNDLGFEHVFSRQIEALGREGDVLVAISTSGASPNINAAVNAARAMGMRVIYLCGATPPGLSADAVVTVPSADTPRIQEVHEIVIHILAELVEDAFSTSS